MTETAASSSGTQRRGGWRRKLGWVLGILIVLLVVAYFVATSSAFFKGVILPKVGKAMNAQITVSEASIRPFSEVVLRNLKVQPNGTEPVLTAAEVRVRYRLLDMIAGKITMPELTVESPVVTVIESADGTSNLDPLRKAREKKPEVTAEKKPSKPAQVDLKKITITNAVIRTVRLYTGGQKDVMELANLKLAVADVKNGQAGTLTLSADIILDQNPPAPGTTATLQAKLAGDFSFALLPDLKPGSLNGTLRFDVTKAAGALADLAALAAELKCEVSPAEVKQVALRFFKSGTPLGQIRVSGPFDMAKTEGSLNIEILNLDRQVLNLAGASSGLDFGTTVVNSTNLVQVANRASAITLNGRLEANRARITRQGQSTPVLDLRGDYSVNVNQASKVAELKTFTLVGTQNERPLLRAELTSPMTISWGTTANAVADSALNVSVDKLDLADWKPFLGEIAPAGKADLRANLVSQQAGKLLRFEATANADNLDLLAGTNRFSSLGVNLEARGQATDLKQFKLGGYRAQLTQRGQQVVSIEGTGNYDTAQHAAAGHVKLLAALPGLMQMLERPDARASSGSLELNAQLTQKDKSQMVTGTLLLAPFSGQFGKNEFRDFGAETEFEIGKDEQQIQIRKAKGTVTEAGKPGGGFEVTGGYNLASHAGDVSVKLAGLNERALRPFLSAALGDKKVVSVTLDGTAAASLDARGDATAKADVRMANLVVSDPQGALPATPLEARALLDGVARKQVAELRQCQLTLTPTDRAKNQLALTGTMDFSKTNAITGSLKLTADSLDFTRYYDLFAGKPAPKQPETAPTAAPGEQKEPDAVNLPFRNFTVDATIGRFYLREVDVANFQTTLKLNDNRVVLNPFQLTLNGAPVNAKADLNLGVPGYQYDVSFNADRVSIEPLANSFSPDYRNQAKGELLATAQIQGAGVTGASLQKSLVGDASLTLTNANIQLVGRKAKLLITPIAFVLGLDELTRSPLNGLDARIKMGGGKIALTQCHVLSDAFVADTAGETEIAPVLNNSQLNDWPINFSLSRRLAAKARLLPADTPTNATFVALPVFAKVGGTLGSPEAKTDKLMIAGLVAKSAVGIPGVTGTKAGNILQGVGGLLTGQTSPAAGATTNATPTNATPAKPSLPFNPLDLFKKK